MAIFMQNFRHRRNGHDKRETQVLWKPAVNGPRKEMAPPLSINPNDPIVAYFLAAPGAVEIDKLHVQSPVLQALKASGVKMVVPMINQGQLVGLLNLGRRLSEQDYSADDRGLLNTLATQAAPAVRVAQLVREQHIRAREREQIEQEMRIARLIQQTLLPKDLPGIAGWQLAAYYQPARAVGGDFYDFLSFDDGRLGIVIGDVTDKGVPAALIMATTRSILRSVAQGEGSPGKVLEQTNNLLCPDMPAKMFVTCLYAILDTSTGLLRYANAGHDQPYRLGKEGVSELWARGMPLGLMPDMQYEEKETTLAQGESVLFYSDGLVESHNPGHEMFGFPRLKALMNEHGNDKALIDVLLDALAPFTGPGWEQEDDVTLVTLKRAGGYGVSQVATRSTGHLEALQSENDSW
jgi:serine phosphatase RsbU (regulator of sigma subunit)